MQIRPPTFEIEVSDIDRSVYDTLTLRVARHLSESAEYPVARLLARGPLLRGRPRKVAPVRTALVALSWSG